MERPLPGARRASLVLGRVNTGNAPGYYYRVQQPDYTQRWVGYSWFMPLHAPARDQQLIQILDAALDDAFQKSSQWLACRPG